MATLRNAPQLTLKINNCSVFVGAPLHTAQPPHIKPQPNAMKHSIRSKFDMLRAHEAQLWRLGALAERYFAEDPNTSLLKLRQLSKLLAQSLAARTGLYTHPEETQYELIHRLQGECVLPGEVRQVFDQIRITGNAANHARSGNTGDAEVGNGVGA